MISLYVEPFLMEIILVLQIEVCRGMFVREGDGWKGEGKGYLSVLRSVFFEALSSLI